MRKNTSPSTPTLTRTRTLRASVSQWNQHWPADSLIFAPYDTLARSLATHPDWPLCAELNQWADSLRALNHSAYEDTVKVTFTPPQKEPALDSQLAPYDQLITEKHCVRTRERHWHDVMNALVWAGFPRAKWALHQRQHEEVLRMTQNAEPNRSPMHDALAMLDEGGVLVLCQRNRAETIADELCAKNRQPLEAALLANEALLAVFGHGILESVALHQKLQPVYAMACVMAVDCVPFAFATSLEKRSIADKTLAEELVAKVKPLVLRPRPSLLLDEPWMAKILGISS